MALARISVSGAWETVFDDEGRHALEALLPSYLPGRRWFGGKARTIEAARLVEAVPLGASYLAFIAVSYTEGAPQTYVLPLAYASGTPAGEIETHLPQAVVAELEVSGRNGLLYDASWDTGFAQAVLHAIEQGSEFVGRAGELAARGTGRLESLLALAGGDLHSSILGAEQSNTSVRYGDAFILKMYRRLEEGINPDQEIGLFLTDKGFANTPSLGGLVEYRPREGDSVTLAILQSFVRNRADAWQYTLSALNAYLDATRAEDATPADIVPTETHPLDLQGRTVPAPVARALGPYLEAARLLGRRTGEMHIALASDASNADFAPEPFTEEYQRSLYEAIRELSASAFSLAQANLERLPFAVRGDVRELLDRRAGIEARFESLRGGLLTAMRTRVHGDYHLGQVLYTGDDFMIIDFEGEPIRTLAERRRKHSPLKDVAGMLRSFHYAAHTALVGHRNSLDGGGPMLDAWVDAWHLWVRSSYLGAYLDAVGNAPFLPATRSELRTLLDALVLEKAIYELVYELNNRPDWVGIPLSGILQLAR